MPTPHIRLIRHTDHTALLRLWERSVRATHHFVAEPDIVFFRHCVAEMLAGSAIELWTLASDGEPPIGLLGLSPHRIEALFLEPEHRRRGWGRRLVAHAQHRWSGSLGVDVNEQNSEACRFYEALGFVVEGRSPVDETGRPYPILHLRRPSPAGVTAAAAQAPG